MKKALIISILTCLYAMGTAQNATNLNLEAYFSAIIVKDIDQSINWYTTVLGFEQLNKFESKERGFSQANLKRDGMLLELIELESAHAIEDLVPNYNNKTKTVGLFKIGFRVNDFSLWLNHFRHNEVNFNGNVVSDSKTGKKMLIITDPDGNRIQLFEK